MTTAQGITIAISIIGLILTILTIVLGQRKASKDNAAAQSKMAAEAAARDARTDVKLEELTREVRKHNNFAARMPVVEEQIKVINHRIADLEGKVG